ncbi:hypothetical protein FE257_008408 [Aspergillus nanangensis]|uniref:DUF1989 domain-containing protein n=1 Tax=Aspergillus nanangensis TaxID=2582783 RepID=A0AAD4CLC3_ASPNN|nr:hypothetical protein FE257_008408 [Aspergillus nanangensis]
MSNALSHRTLPARGAAAILVKKGQSIKVINTFGKQVVDFFAFGVEFPNEHLSMVHTRSMNSKLYAKQGDQLYSSRRRTMFTFVEDTSPGVHDMVWAPCDRERYRMLGCEGYHDNCSDNLHRILSENFPAQAIRDSWTPDPLNLFMNVPIAADGGLSITEPVSSAGQFVLLRAEMDVVVAMSACPQDMVPTNGKGPTSCEFQIVKEEA